MATKFCTNCGLEVTPTSKYCGSCGHLVMGDHSSVVQASESKHSSDILAYCNNCGRKIDPDAQICDKCGNELATATDASSVDEPGSHDPHFIVTPGKLCVMSVCTLGLYNIYWFYKQWVALAKDDPTIRHPFWRALFSIFYIYSLFKRLGASQPVPLGIAYVLLELSAKLPAGWWLISLSSPVPLMIVQSQLNTKAKSAGDGGNFSSRAIMVCILGAIVILLALIGTFTKLS